jgi:serine protease Do
VLSIAALQQALPRGAAVFSLSGNFLGLAADGGATATVIPGDILLASAQSARAVDETRGDVGVTVQPLTAGLSRATGAERGVVVSYVHPRGPAVDLLEPGDVIQSVDGTAVSTPAGFQQVVQSRPPGGQSALDVMRRGKPTEVQITVRDATGAPLPPLPEDDPGLVMRLVPDLGVEIVAVRPGSAAARANLAAGDIILRLNGALAPSPAALLSAYRQLPAQGALLLAVQRGADHRAVALER